MELSLALFLDINLTRRPPYEKSFIFDSLLYVGAFIALTKTLVLTISHVIDYIKYREIYIAISSTAIRSILITFVSSFA